MDKSLIKCKLPKFTQEGLADLNNPIIRKLKRN